MEEAWYTPSRKFARWASWPKEANVSPSQANYGSSRFLVGDFSQFRQHAGEDFQSEVVFVAKTVGLPLNGAGLVVEPLDEA